MPQAVFLKSRWKAGYCQVKTQACQGFTERLERHHESYKPERTCYVCHACHNLIHFRPWQLTTMNKEKLITVRFGFDIVKDPARFRQEVENYKPPSRETKKPEESP